MELLGGSGHYLCDDGYCELRNIELDDAQLIASSLAEPACFGELYDRHATAVYRYLVHFAGIAVAEDLAAETFAVAFQGRFRYAPMHASALPWLLGSQPTLGAGT